tara:strand:+ start:125 stop:391 length:267 start_codon:yes stop_codon:yes gene_type:complete
MRYINPKSNVTGRILGLHTPPLLQEPTKDISEELKYKPSVPKVLKSQEKPKLLMGKGIGDNEFRDKLKKLSLQSLPQKEKLKNISFDM